MDLTDSFLVYVRVRPTHDRTQNLLSVQNHTLFMADPYIQRRTVHSFAFDRVFTEEVRNEQVFDQAITHAVQNLIKGYNSTVFAYGTTGSGKTHSMFGGVKDPGLIQQTVKSLLKQFPSLKLSFLEIYNEQIRDLLKKDSDNLGIIQDTRGVQVPGLSDRQVSSEDDVLAIIEEGNCLRVMAPTNNNQFSSRSHAIVQLTVGAGQKLSMVDLAGSERANGQGKGTRLTQGCNINRSLLALGNCIMLLGEKKKKVFIPYRDSKLTRLLKDSLGGNAKTIMLACVSASCTFFDDTLCTLKYAARAKNIEKEVKIINRKESSQEIEALRQQLASLKQRLEHQCDAIKVEGLTEQLAQNIEDGLVIKNAIKQVLAAQHKFMDELDLMKTRGREDQCKELDQAIVGTEQDYIQLQKEYQSNLLARKELQSKIVEPALENARLVKENEILKQANKDLQSIKPPNKQHFRRTSSLFRKEAQPRAISAINPKPKVIKNFSSVSTNVASQPEVQLPLSKSSVRSTIQQRSSGVCQLHKKRADYLSWRQRLVELAGRKSIEVSQIQQLEREGQHGRTQQDSQLIKALYRFTEGDIHSLKQYQRVQELAEVKAFLRQFE